MKKGILSAIGLFFAIEAQAQMQKGNGLLAGGGSFTYSQQTGNAFKTNTVAPRINVTYGQFVADNWLIGAEVGFSASLIKSQSTISQVGGSRQTAYSPSLTPFFRRYWTVGPIAVFGGAGLQLSTEHSLIDLNRNTGAAAVTRTNVYSVVPTVTVGGTYFLSNRLALEGAVRADRLPMPASSVGLGLIYWAGPTGTGASNPETIRTSTQEGNWIIEGGFRVSEGNRTTRSINQNDDSNSRDLFLNASIGRFVATNTLIGVGLGFSSTGQKQRLSRETTSQTYSVSPFVQRYLTKRRLTPFLRAALSYSETRTVGFSERTNSWQGAASVGLAYLISNRFLAETTLANASYQYLRFNQNNGIHSVNFLAGLGNGFSVRYVIAGKK